MSAAPKVSRVSPKQRAADKSNLARARAAQRRSGALHHHTARQKAASVASLVKARAAQKSRRAGKTPVASKKAAAPDTWTRYDGVSLHQLPACGPVAVAAHLAMFTGICLADEDILALHDRAGVVSLGGLLERVSVEGLAGPGTRLAWFERCNPDAAVPGLLYGVEMPGIGYHAVLLRDGGIQSWGRLLPCLGTPAEAWWLEWEAEQ